MKRTILTAAIIFVSSLGFSQTARYPNAQPGYEGIFILLSGQLSNSSFTIERCESKKNNWTNVGKSKIVTSFQEFRGNFEYYSNRFPDLLQPKDSRLENIWNVIQRTKNLDSLYFYGNSPVLRLALGVSFFDSTAERNKSYKYRINQTDSISGRTSSFTTNDVSFPGKLSLGKPVLVFARSSAENVFLQWRILPDERLSSFIVFRQSNAKGDFEKINVSKGLSKQRDSIVLTLQDRPVEKNIFYKYFVIPVDLFGNRGEPSDTVVCGTYDFSAVTLPTNITVESIDSLPALKLSWKIPEKQPVVSLQIFRSEIFDSSFALVAELPPNSTEYLDENVKPMQKYFYYFRLVGPLSEISPATARVFGLPKSSKAPIPPVQVKAEALSNGVKLSWKNTENFIEGFWVYRTNGMNDSLRLVSSLIKERKPFTTFYDTTGLSGKLTYQYAIRSSSVSHVLSDFSDTIAIRPKIKTTPPSPMELTAELVDSTAVLKWKDMREIESSVWGYLVFRKTVGGKSDFKSLTDSALTFYQNYFSDKTIKPGNLYEYQVKTVDMFGGISDPSIVTLEFRKAKPLAPEGLTAVRTKAGIELTWNESIQSNIKEYRIYRQTRNSKPTLIAKVKSGKETKVIDKSFSKNELYFYFVTAVDSFDLESEASRIISIRP